MINGAAINLPSCRAVLSPWPQNTALLSSSGSLTSHTGLSCQGHELFLSLFPLIHCPPLLSPTDIAGLSPLDSLWSPPPACGTHSSHQFPNQACVPLWSWLLWQHPPAGNCTLTSQAVSKPLFVTGHSSPAYQPMPPPPLGQLWLHTDQGTSLLICSAPNATCTES